MRRLSYHRVYRHEINEATKRLKLWVRRKRGNRKLICSGCGEKFEEYHDVTEREVRDNARYYWLLLVEGHLNRQRFRAMLGRIALLPVRGREKVVKSAAESALQS
jgi:hypothetical protein